jgi:hypothetical protein
LSQPGVLGHSSIVLTADAESEFRRFADARGLAIEHLDAAEAAVLICDWYSTTRVDGVSLDSDGDMLLFQWGTYSWNDDKFSYDFTRQFIIDADTDDEALWRLSLTLLFDDDADEVGSGNRWCQRPNELDDFRSFVASASATTFALSRAPVVTRLTFGPTG